MERVASDLARDTLKQQLATTPDLTGAGLESAAHRAVSDAVTRSVEAWRTARADAVRAALAQLDERVRASLDADFDALRTAARALLGARLAARRTGVTLAPSRNFYYQFRVEADPAGELAAAIRHHLPGRYRRSRSVTYLRALIARQAGQQVGRARSDVQERLTESTRAMLAALTENYADHHTRMLAALDAADANAKASTSDSAAVRALLTTRRAALTEILRVLAECGHVYDAQTNSNDSEAGDTADSVEATA